MVRMLVSRSSVQVWVLVGGIVLCPWARHLTLTVPLSTQVHKWVPANVMLGINLRWTSIPARGVEIFVVTSLRRNPEITGLGMERLLFYLTFPNEPCFVLLYMLFLLFMMWQIKHDYNGDLLFWELAKWMASNAQVKVVTLVAVKARTNYKTLTPIALEPEQVNIKRNHTCER